MNKEIAGFSIDSIYISPDAGSPMLRIDSVEVKNGLGLVGDRYASRKGFWQNIPNPASIGRDVSITKSSDVVGSGFSESETRRNIFVSGGLRLTDLIGKSFYIGEVLFFATEECTPCKRPSDLCGKPGFARAMKEKGGIRGRAMSDGTIKVGDKFRDAD